MPESRDRAITRRGTLGVLAAAGVAAALPPARSASAGEKQPLVQALELEEATFEQLARAMTGGSLSSKELCRRYLERIRALDGHLSSILQVNPQALEIARELDRERREKGPRGPLHDGSTVFTQGFADNPVGGLAPLSLPASRPRPPRPYRRPGARRRPASSRPS